MVEHVHSIKDEPRGTVACNDKSEKLSNYLIKIARLGGHLNRASGPPPGNIVMWRGLARLIEIQL